MWPLVSEWCADVLAGTARGYRLVRGLAALLAATALILAFMARWGLVGAVPPLLLIGVLMMAGRDVFVARERLWRAAVLPLDTPRQLPDWDGDARLAAPTAVALNRLAIAVDAARRSQYVEASEIVHVIDRRLLRPGEVAMLEAVRALICVGLGDTARAAQLAVLALPTGARDVDVPLGRAVLADAWGDTRRLSAVDEAWQAAGVRSGGVETLATLRALVHVRIDPQAVERLRPIEAAALSDEARAIGDDDLAADLAARARRSGTYR